MDFDNIIQIDENNKHLLCKELFGDVLLYINFLLSLNNVYLAPNKIKPVTLIDNRDNHLGNYSEIIKFNLKKHPILVSHIEINNSGIIGCHMYRIVNSLENLILLNIRNRNFNLLLNES